MMQDDFGNLVPSGKTASLNERLIAGDERMNRIEGSVAALSEEMAENTKATREVADSTKDLVEFFQAMKGAFKVLNWLGKIAKPAGYIVALGTAVAGFWSALKGGKL
ncbi:hypothetical protein [Diaphorobacter sp. HDW4B]|uniref:hypothetical protein n=1 Tax=Diaphorobacter sp. HDW4B TaxID=2714925 RepID=UPI001F0DDD3A|nr:hypothetical protein [Diaphorobacter sp. HDW4B]